MSPGVRVIEIERRPAGMQVDAGLLPPEISKRFGAQNRKENLDFTPKTLRAINCHRRPGSVLNYKTVEKRAVIIDRQQADNRQRLEFTSQAAPSTTLKEAGDNIETEVVQQALKKHVARSGQWPPTSAVADLP